ncbi:hypothetical protein FPOAC2_03884 [Fusarium poae]|jgi:hypothetical protein|uniref:hypothetical protein n=1 Tax=Fusarium poae TaxID=36050 RepID=UPI001CE719C6|nr:hypothetical protein FPOAC1_003775 [Fusarium poae]KAG8677747.1 hypothetical protein FPOAC1_003775 [Fusarium poae]
MSRHLVRSFLLATALTPMVNAGPCRPQTISASSQTDTLTQAVSSSTIVFSSLNPGDTSQSATVSEDAVTAIGTSTIDATLSVSDISSVSAETSGDATVSTDLSSDTALVTISATYAGTTSTEMPIGSETDITTMTSVDITTTATSSLAPTTEASSTAAATSTEIAPACTPTLIYPTPEDVVCGRQGNPLSTTNFMGVAVEQASEDIWSCYKACKDTPECGSVFFYENLYCELWKGKPGETNNLPSESSWWDMDCFTCLAGETEPTTPTQPEPTCKDNLINPLPQYRVCGEMGDGTGLYEGGPGPDGSAQSLQACAKACSVGQCSAIKFEAGQECTFYRGGGFTIGDPSTTTYKWYDQDCFCDLDKPGDDEDVCVDELPKTTVCAVQGRPKNICLEDITPFAPSSTKSLEACRDLCKNNDCNSIAFKKDEWCSIFKGQVGGTSEEIDVPGLKMWDMACFDETETGPNDPEPSCINNMLSPSPKNSNCGATGQPTAVDPTSFLSHSVSSSLEACHDGCSSLSQCKSFIFQINTGCICLSASTVQVDGTDTEWKVYDLSCFCEGTT